MASELLILNTSTCKKSNKYEDVLSKNAEIAETGEVDVGWVKGKASSYDKLWFEPI